MVTRRLFVFVGDQIAQGDGNVGEGFLPRKDYIWARDDPDLLWPIVHAQTFVIPGGVGLGVRAFVYNHHGGSDNGSMQLPIPGVFVYYDRSQQPNSHTDPLTSGLYPSEYFGPDQSFMLWAAGYPGKGGADPNLTPPQSQDPYCLVKTGAWHGRLVPSAGNLGTIAALDDGPSNVQVDVTMTRPHGQTPSSTFTVWIYGIADPDIYLVTQKADPQLTAKHSATADPTDPNKFRITLPSAWSGFGQPNVGRGKLPSGVVITPDITIDALTNPYGNVVRLELSKNLTRTILTGISFSDAVLINDVTGTTTAIDGHKSYVKNTMTGMPLIRSVIETGTALAFSKVHGAVCRTTGTWTTLPAANSRLRIFGSTHNNKITRNFGAVNDGSAVSSTTSLTFAGKVITRSSGSWDNTPAEGDFIVVSSTSLNNGVLRVDSATSNTITVDSLDILFAETIGATIINSSFYICGPYPQRQNGEDHGLIKKEPLRAEGPPTCVLEKISESCHFDHITRTITLGSGTWNETPVAGDRITVRGTSLFLAFTDSRVDGAKTVVSATSTTIVVSEPLSIYIAFPNIGGPLIFDDTTRTITLASGIWRRTPLVGEFITVSLTANNNGVFEVLSATATVITLAVGEVLVDETIAGQIVGDHVAEVALYASRFIEYDNRAAVNIGGWASDGYVFPQDVWHYLFKDEFAGEAAYGRAVAAIADAADVFDNGILAALGLPNDDVDCAGMAVQLGLGDCNATWSTGISSGVICVFSSVNRRITRTAGTWFATPAAGTIITVSETQFNNGAYEVGSATSTTITLVAGTVIIDEAALPAIEGAATNERNSVTTGFQKAYEETVAQLRVDVAAVMTAVQTPADIPLVVVDVGTTTQPQDIASHGTAANKERNKAGYRFPLINAIRLGALRTHQRLTKCGFVETANRAYMDWAASAGGGPPGDQMTGEGVIDLGANMFQQIVRADQDLPGTAKSAIPVYILIGQSEVVGHCNNFVCGFDRNPDYDGRHYDPQPANSFPTNFTGGGYDDPPINRPRGCWIWNHGTKEFEEYAPQKNANTFPARTVTNWGGFIGFAVSGGLGVGTVGPEASLILKLRQYHPGGVFLIKLAVGSASLGDNGPQWPSWLPSRNDLWTDLTKSWSELIQWCCDHELTPDLRAFVFYQGGGDINIPNTYESTLRTFITTVREHFSTTTLDRAKLPFIIGRVQFHERDNSGDHASGVRNIQVIQAAQNAVAASVENVSIVGMEGLGITDDGIHPTWVGTIETGRRLSAALQATSLLSDREWQGRQTGPWGDPNFTSPEFLWIPQLGTAPIIWNPDGATLDTATTGEILDESGLPSIIPPGSGVELVT